MLLRSQEGFSKMFVPDTTPNERRLALRASLESTEITKLPGAFNPLTARLIEDLSLIHI